jgi:ssDNA-binding Zn-finger/Zn-ribbon topoisomerase 1
MVICPVCGKKYPFWKTQSFAFSWDSNTYCPYCFKKRKEMLKKGMDEEEIEKEFNKKEKEEKRKVKEEIDYDKQLVKVRNPEKNKENENRRLSPFLVILLIIFSPFTVTIILIGIMLHGNYSEIKSLTMQSIALIYLFFMIFILPRIWKALKKEDNKQEQDDEEEQAWRCDKCKKRFYLNKIEKGKLKRMGKVKVLCPHCKNVQFCKN